MACVKCREVKKWTCRMNEISNDDRLSVYYTHAIECIHHANFCLIRLLSSIALQKVALFADAFLYHEGPFRYYVLKNKPLFKHF